MIFAPMNDDRSCSIDIYIIQYTYIHVHDLCIEILKIYECMYYNEPVTYTIYIYTQIPNYITEAIAIGSIKA